MASTALELARRAHEDIERLERRACRALTSESASATHKGRLTANRLASGLVEAAADRAKRLVRVRRDAREVDRGRARVEAREELLRPRARSGGDDGEMAMDARSARARRTRGTRAEDSIRWMSTERMRFEGLTTRDSFLDAARGV
jgi:hypothetical protein